jgi:hypothetical protein
MPGTAVPGMARCLALQTMGFAARTADSLTRLSVHSAGVRLQRRFVAGRYAARRATGEIVGTVHANQGVRQST